MELMPVEFLPAADVTRLLKREKVREEIMADYDRRNKGEK